MDYLDPASLKPIDPTQASPGALVISSKLNALAIMLTRKNGTRMAALFSGGRPGEVISIYTVGTIGAEIVDWRIEVDPSSLGEMTFVGFGEYNGGEMGAAILNAGEICFSVGGGPDDRQTVLFGCDGQERTVTLPAIGFRKWRIVTGGRDRPRIIHTVEVVTPGA